MSDTENTLPELEDVEVIDLTKQEPTMDEDGNYIADSFKESDEEVIVYHNTKDTGARWLYNPKKDKFIFLNLPSFFKDAPEETKTELVAWIRNCAIAKIKGIDKPKMPKSVLEWRMKPEIVLQIDAKKHRGQATLDVF